MIRPQALALIRRGGRILVEQGRDEVEDETLFRLLGGTIEFGEKGADTVRRELLEELHAEIDVGDLIATVENVFTYEGEPAHEIALVYESSFRESGSTSSMRGTPPRGRRTARFSSTESRGRESTRSAAAAGRSTPRSCCRSFEQPNATRAAGSGRRNR
jgi:ADP-ribose pyrophosphatase YjhB (NUDIX family)